MLEAKLIEDISHAINLLPYILPIIVGFTTVTFNKRSGMSSFHPRTNNSAIYDAKNHTIKLNSDGMVGFELYQQDEISLRDMTTKFGSDRVPGRQRVIVKIGSHSPTDVADSAKFMLENGVEMTVNYSNTSV